MSTSFDIRGISGLYARATEAGARAADPCARIFPTPQAACGWYAHLVETYENWLEAVHYLNMDYPTHFRKIFRTGGWLWRQSDSNSSLREIPC